MAAHPAAGVIDAHVHLWERARFAYPWIQPGSPLDRDVRPADLRAVLADSPIAGGLLVEAANVPAEIPWLLDCAARLPGVWGVIGSLPLDQPGAPGVIAQWAADPRFRGVRLNWLEPRPDMTPLRPAMDALARAGLALDILCSPAYLPEIARFAREHTGLPIVLDHFAGSAPGRQSLASAVADLEPFGPLYHVAVKVSGFASGAAPRDAASLRAALACLDGVFGPGRMLFGSDYPLCLSHGSYAELLALAQDAASGWDARWQDALFRHAACSIYRLHSEKFP